ncbi:hypothetical protein LJT99_13280 [Lentisphaerae bacterium WC36]|nr:hypothetical protein LJT99_13280 [Lentisphaerae bacterium WC36]
MNNKEDIQHGHNSNIRADVFSYGLIFLNIVFLILIFITSAKNFNVGE